MNLKALLPCLAFCVALATPVARADEQPPANPNATPEARALLHFLYSISGRHTLTGQHNYPATKDQYTLSASRYRGKVPAIFGQDFGFAKDGDKDAVSARPDMIAEVKRQFALGSIVTLCWHAVPPTASEPVTFRPPTRGSNTNDHSVQGQLTDRQFLDILTPGTPLYSNWCAQVDVIAGYLKQLQDAHIPVLWRPYHEMNGDWFWWGGRLGEHGTAALYRQLYDRFVNYHHLNNLLWIWSLDRPATANRAFANFYPGADRFDVAALDCYGPFEQDYYDGLRAVARGKVVTLAEVGAPPALEVLEKQPDWCWWMSWAGFGAGPRRPPGGTNSVAGTNSLSGTNSVARTNAVPPAGNFLTAGQMKLLVNDPRSWSLSDEDYRKAIEPIRIAAGYPVPVPAPEIPPPAPSAH